ncbi:MAG: hypothetical protein A3G82_13380 [Burkholderiales bacterium RIFCSPLOWO2_12_FULL_67_210]|nr:MAG: hypothetical protein A3G82_13380 [Burkholderiales bacterium RIFCSPLOWO2_12_FULL_67_210]
MSAMASALTWNVPLAMACFMASTFSALNTSLPPAAEPCMAETVEEDRVTVTPAWGCAAAPAAAAASAPAAGRSAAFCGPPATEPM